MTLDDLIYALKKNAFHLVVHYELGETLRYRVDEDHYSSVYSATCGTDALINDVNLLYESDIPFAVYINYDQVVTYKSGYFEYITPAPTLSFYREFLGEMDSEKLNYIKVLHKV